MVSTDVLVLTPKRWIGGADIQQLREEACKHLVVTHVILISRLFSTKTSPNVSFKEVSFSFNVTIN